MIFGYSLVFYFKFFGYNLWVYSFGILASLYLLQFGYLTCRIYSVFGYKHLGIRAFINIITLSFWVFIFTVYMFHLGIIINFSISFGYLSLYLNLRLKVSKLH